jgi:translation elongation factor EF-1beta
MSFALYEITNSVIQAQHEDVNTDELDALQVAFDDKAIGCACVIKNLKAETDAIDAEIKRLQKLKDTRMNNINRLKAYVLSAMQHIGRKQVRLSVHTLRVQKNSRLSITVTDKDLVPPRFIKKTVTVSVDKSAVESAVKETGEVPTGLDVTHGEHLRIT